MSTKPRKKFQVRIDGQAARNFPSEGKAYDYAFTDGRRLAHGPIRILIDEGYGRGWQPYETLSVRDLAR